MITIPVSVSESACTVPVTVSATGAAFSTVANGSELIAVSVGVSAVAEPVTASASEIPSLPQQRAIA